MKTPHKHSELIKAWADGAEIEYRSRIDGNWTTAGSPQWFDNSEYRIKPEPRPDVIRYATATLMAGFHDRQDSSNLKLTFDGSTGKLKAAEVLK
jgi:hypothetical protein